MKGIHLVMPMAGGGTRFLECGFDCPKPLIKIHGKPFFYWATESIYHFVNVVDVVFVVLREHVQNFGIDKTILGIYPQAKIRIIDTVLNGAVMTCLEAIKEIDDDCPILFNDCDHAFIANSFYRHVRNSTEENVDGALLTFQSDEPIYSYVVYDGKGEVSGTVEKVVASDEAICGAYYFRSKDIFQKAASSYLVNCSYQEFFMSGLYNEMLLEGRKVVTFPLDEHISFGTPEEYEKVKMTLELH